MKLSTEKFDVILIDVNFPDVFCSFESFLFDQMTKVFSYMVFKLPGTIHIIINLHCSVSQTLLSFIFSM